MSQRYPQGQVSGWNAADHQPLAAARTRAHVETDQLIIERIDNAATTGAARRDGHPARCRPTSKGRAATPRLAARDPGATTVEYAIGTIAAAEFAGLLIVILKSDWCARLSIHQAQHPMRRDIAGYVTVELTPYCFAAVTLVIGVIAACAGRPDRSHPVPGRPRGRSRTSDGKTARRTRPRPRIRAAPTLSSVGMTYDRHRQRPPYRGAAGWIGARHTARSPPSTRDLP